MNEDEMASASAVVDVMNDMVLELYGYEDLPIGPHGCGPNIEALTFCFDTASSGGKIRLDWMLPPPWYVPVEAPPCNVHLHVPAEDTKDNTARNFYCDKPAGHPAPDGTAGSHRMVYRPPNHEGKAFTWPVAPDASTPTSPATSTASKTTPGDTGSASDD